MSSTAAAPPAALSRVVHVRVTDADYLRLKQLAAQCPLGGPHALARVLLLRALDAALACPGTLFGGAGDEP